MDFYSIVQETLNQGDSLEDFYQKWIENMDKAKGSFISDPQHYEIISEFISRNTDFIKSTMELYQKSTI